MAAKIDQKAYLQKYLSGSNDKKKKKKKSFKGKGLTIIDADVDVTKLRALDGDELDFLGEGEDAPQIAGIIDERPEEVRRSEQFNTTTKWRVINQDDGFNSKLQIQEIKKDVKEMRKENEIVFGKMYSDDEDSEKRDSDLSPPRKNKEKSKKSKRNSDSDISPPRKRPEPKEARAKSSDSDISPPRRKHKEESSKNNHQSQRDAERSRKPSRWGQWETNENNNKRHDSDSSPPRNSKHKSQRDQSPAHRSKKTDKKTTRRQSDSDQSPPRRHDSNRERKHQDSDTDLSPPRKNKRTQSPVKQRHKSTRPEPRHSDSPPPTNSKMARTLEGKVAGLQDAKQLREENEDFRRREDEAFKRLGDEVSGRNAKAVSRKGKRETSEERQKQKDKAEKQKELDDKYKKWSAGLKQLEDKEARYQDFLHEASKPLARHKGDTDLEDRLKKIERDGDPMLKYMRQKKRERGELGPERPMYKGDFPPNRFNIRPGHRWDGVDRSNGYEKKYFQNQSKRRAHEEDAYKWSTEDL